MSDYIRVIEDLEVSHGVDGWTLVEMDWSAYDGMSCFQYERTVVGEGVELAIVWRAQPATFEHNGWWKRDRTERVLELSKRDWSRIERGLYNEPVDMDSYE